MRGVWGVRGWVGWLGLVGGGLVSVGCVVWVLGGVSWGELWGVLGGVRWVWVLPVVVLFYVGVWFRGLRWRWLLGGEGLGLGRVVFWEGVLVGFGFNNVLPSGRLGELARAWYVARRGGGSVAVVLGSVAGDRVFDCVAVLLLVLVGVWWWLGLEGGESFVWDGVVWSEGVLGWGLLGVGLGCLVFGGLVLVLLWGRVAGWVRGVAGGLPWVSGRVRGWLVGFVEGVFRGLEGVRDGRRLCWGLVYTVLVWVVNVCAAFVLAWAVPGLSLGWFEALGLVGLSTLCAAVPSVPGFWGVYEAGMVFGFRVLGVDADASVGLVYGLVMHLVYFVPSTVFGLALGFRAAVAAGLGGGFSDGGERKGLGDGNEVG